MPSGNKVTLNSGRVVPTLGFGTWQAGPGEAGAAVFEALKAGYRHLDLAKIYGNQKEIGEAIKRGLDEIPDLKRTDLFITSKLWNDKHRPDDVLPALDETLEELGLDYLDLYLIHWPVAFVPGNGSFPKDPSKEGFVHIDETVSIADTWKAMTELPKDKVHSVGVSNFTIDDLNAIINATGVTPAVNQVERHPRIPDSDLMEFCKTKDIVITAYSAFGNNGVGEPLLVNHPVIKKTAERLSESTGKTVTPAQVILAWSQHDGHLVIPKSVTASRIAENFQNQDVELDWDARNAIAKIGGQETHRFNVPYTYTPKWDVNIFGDDKETEASSKVIRSL